MEMLVTTMLALAAIAYVGYPLVSSKRDLYYLENVLGLSEHKTLSYLYSKRNMVYDNIKDLEMEYDMGKLANADFSRLREGLLGEAEAIVREIDAAKARQEVEDLIERDARTHRKVK